jgi:RNA-binding protein
MNRKKGMVISMTSKERAELKSQAMKLDSIFQIGKSSLTPQMTEAVKDALHARELIKLSVLKNCTDDPKELAQILADRTGSQVVQVIGKKIVLYKQNPEKEKKRKQKETAGKKDTGRKGAGRKEADKKDFGKKETGKKGLKR